MIKLHPYVSLSCIFNQISLASYKDISLLPYAYIEKHANDSNPIPEHGRPLLYIYSNYCTFNIKRIKGKKKKN